MTQQGRIKNTLSLNQPCLANRAGLALVIWFAACWVAFASAHAQDTMADPQETLKAMYVELLIDPTNLERTIEYAAYASKIGDYESAIPPLERLLLTYPNAGKIQLELGVLYHQLGADDIARSYWSRVITNESADDAHRAKADEMLKQL